VTSSEYENAIQFVASVIRLITDPDALARLRMLKAEVDGTLGWVERFDPVAGYERTPEKGTCPTCGRLYAFAGDQGGLRRHGKGRCSLDVQMAAEIVPAVLLISQLSEVSTEGTTNVGTQHKNTDHV
jgi:hypothetical protein